MVFAGPNLFLTTAPARKSVVVVQRLPTTFFLFLLSIGSTIQMQEERGRKLQIESHGAPDFESMTVDELKNAL